MADDWTGRDLADEATGSLRDKAPDTLGVPDPTAPVSGHRPAPAGGGPAGGGAAAPEHDWEAARGLVYPILRPAGTTGAAADVPLDVLRSSPVSHTTPLVSDGPCGLVVSFVLQGGGFDVLVNAEHLVSWGVDADELAGAAGANLAAWSAEAGWTDEISGSRRILSSDTGDHDAARILLTEVRAHLASELANSAVAGTRILVGVPERHMLLAGTMTPGDEEFAVLFHGFVSEQSEAAEEPIDRRVLELVGGELVEFAG